MARQPTHCSNCGGPGHRVQTCETEDHYKCDNCGKIFQKYVNHGRCDVCQSHLRELGDDWKSDEKVGGDLIDKMKDIVENASRVKLDDPDLVKNWVNGFIREDENFRSLADSAKKVLSDSGELIEKIDAALTQHKESQAKLEQIFQAAQQGEIKLFHSIKIGEKEIDLGGSVHPSNILPRMIKLAKAGTAICIVGPSGVGKSFAAQQLQEVLKQEDADYSRFDVISLTEGLSETSLFGRQNIITGEWQETQFLDIYEHGGVFLFDEIDASDPNMLLSVNRAMAQNDLRNPYTGKMHKRHPKFLPIAAANTTMRGANALYVARNRIDAATINRFSAGWIMMKWDKKLEQFLCPDSFLVNRLWDLRKYLEENASSELVSTRTIEYAYRNKILGGMNYSEIFDSITCVWSDDLRDDVYSNVLTGHNIRPIIEAEGIEFDLTA